MDECALDPTAFDRRLGEWETVLAPRLINERVSGNTRLMELRRSPGLVGELTRLVELEGQCCSHLEFKIRTAPETVTLEIVGAVRSVPVEIGKAPA